MKVGSSPIYYLLGQESNLEFFSHHLNNKEKEAFTILKDKKIAPFKLPERLLLLDSLRHVSGLKLDRKKVREMAIEKLGIKT